MSRALLVSLLIFPGVQGRCGPSLGLLEDPLGRCHANGISHPRTAHAVRGPLLFVFRP